MRRHPELTSVLVVEDDRAARDLYRTALMSAGFDVTTVSDGIDALHAMEADVPDAVVLDLNLPRLGGLDLYREMRARDVTRSVPVVVVTGTDAQHSDFPFFLRKPIHGETLSDAVENAIRRTKPQPVRVAVIPCPVCHETNTRKTTEAIRTELHICLACHQIFTVNKPLRDNRS